jgi:hypothetical protein
LFFLPYLFAALSVLPHTFPSQACLIIIIPIIMNPWSGQPSLQGGTRTFKRNYKIKIVNTFNNKRGLAVGTSWTPAGCRRILSSPRRPWVPAGKGCSWTGNRCAGTQVSHSEPLFWTRIKWPKVCVSIMWPKVLVNS